MKNEILYRGFENIPTRRGRGGTYSYIRWQDVADRMNEAFGTQWSSEVMSQDIESGNIVVRVRVSVFDRETGTFSKQEGFGGAPNDDRAEAGNPYKAAYSKALKDACKKWGLALFLEEEDAGAVPQSTPSAPPPGMQGPEYGTPPTAPPTPSVSQAVVSSLPPTPAADAQNLAPEVREMAAPSAPTSNGLPTPPGMAMPTPGQQNIVQESVAVQQQPEPEPAPPVHQEVPAIPPAPTAATEIAPPPVQQAAAPSQGLPTPPSVNMNSEMPMSKAGTINTGEPERISDVQKAALQGILSYKDVEYEPLAREAFEANGVAKSPIPAIDDLTYQEAVYVVKYGNDKFRRR